MPVNDQWGGIQIPVAAPAAGFPAGDPTLKYILDFLKAFLVTDANATAAWSAVYPTKPPVNTVFPHNPGDTVYSTEYAPALFMWRESARQERVADDWLRATTVVKALWVFPPAASDQQRQRSPFVNALCKAVAVGIERGRTPGWIVAGDTDPSASTKGSLLYTWAGFESFALTSWRTSALVIPSNDGTTRTAHPAVEITFSMEENLQYGIDGLDPNYQAAVTVAQGTTATSVVYDDRITGISGLTGYFLDTFVTTGSNITQWTDLSGKGNHLAGDSGEGGYPTVTASFLNGHAVSTHTPQGGVQTVPQHGGPQKYYSAFPLANLVSETGFQVYSLVYVIDLSTLNATINTSLYNYRDAWFSDDQLRGVTVGLPQGPNQPVLTLATGKDSRNGEYPVANGTAVEVIQLEPPPLGAWFLTTLRLRAGNAGLRLGRSAPFSEVASNGPHLSTYNPKLKVGTGGGTIGSSASVIGMHGYIAALAFFSRALTDDEDAVVIRNLQSYSALTL